jgi:tryptophan synthase alpha chain
VSKISDAFRGKKVFITYLTAGDPTLEKTREYVIAMERAGAGLVEIGIPFSDPIAEGETIQKANLRAFASGTTLEGIFEMTDSLKKEISIPMSFLSYVNPLFNYGYDNFFRRCAECGVSGIIIPDLPFEEQDEVLEHAERHGVDLITLVAPTSGERIVKIARRAKGFIYLVSSLGVTGVRNEIGSDIQSAVSEIRRHTDTPIAVGFGIHTPEQAGELSLHADGVIVGSAIVNIIAELGGSAADKISDYVRSMKASMT